MRYLACVCLLVLSACSVWSRSPTMWKDVRPVWEERITRQVHENFFKSRDNVKVNTFVIPIGDPPEVRIVILANVETAKRQKLVEHVDSVVRRVMRYASDTVYTDKIRIQLTSYAGGKRMASEYWNHEWEDLSSETSDTQFLLQAQKDQDTLAKQKGLE